MDKYIFKQFEYARENTLSVVEGITEEVASYIPEGFKNNIHWHLGHLYFYTEKFSFEPVGLPMRLPEEFIGLFAHRTSPIDWNTRVPSVNEIILMLAEQPQRVRSALEHRLHEKVAQPFTIEKDRLTLETVSQFAYYNLIHEGEHLTSIKNYKVLYFVQITKS